MVQGKQVFQMMSSSTQKNNLVKRKRVGAPSSSYKGKSTVCKSSKVVVKEEQRRLVALDYPGPEVLDVCQYRDELVVFDGLIRFLSNDSGEAVRDKIAAKLQQKKRSCVDLKTCGPDDFDFVKVANKRVRLPDGNEEFDSRTISGIYKQGAIYVRLNRSFTVFQENDDDDDSGEEAPSGSGAAVFEISQRNTQSFSRTVNSNQLNDSQRGTHSSSSTVKGVCNVTEELTNATTETRNLSDRCTGAESSRGSSCGNLSAVQIQTDAEASTSYDHDKLMKEVLLEMFPDADSELIEEAVHDSIELDDAIDFVLNHTQGKTAEESLMSALRPLQLKLTSKPNTRLEIDPSDLVADAIAFYKGPKFDPDRPVRVTYVSQPALDSGGVRRQFYTDLFSQLVSENQFKLFQGTNNRLLFHYDQTALGCGLFKTLGQMIAHSICQGCTGFPYLAPAMYYYLTSGDINQAAAYASIADISNEDELRYVEKVMNDEDVNALNEDDSFLKLMQESGLTVSLTEKNRDAIVHCLVTHLVVSRRVAMLEQFAKGLETLGVLQAVRSHPAVFEELFTSKTKLTPEEVKSKIKLKHGSSGCSNDETVFVYIQKFVDESNDNELKGLLKFATGGEVLTPCAIQVDVSPISDSIFASTCLCEIVIPEAMASWNYESFKAALLAVMTGNTFNCV